MHPEREKIKWDVGIPHYGERDRHGEVITTRIVASTVNRIVSKRFCKRQPMQGSKWGAHLLLQARVKTVNREWTAVFTQGYPDIEIEEWDAAASCSASACSLHLLTSPVILEPQTS
jgi:hypothetical protein